VRESEIFLYAARVTSNDCFVFKNFFPPDILKFFVFVSQCGRIKKILFSRKTAEREREIDFFNVKGFLFCTLKRENFSWKRRNAFDVISIEFSFFLEEISREFE
jgi:hypothetical protein